MRGLRRCEAVIARESGIYRCACFALPTIPAIDFAIPAFSTSYGIPRKRQGFSKQNSVFGHLDPSFSDEPTPPHYITTIVQEEPSDSSNPNSARVEHTTCRTPCGICTIYQTQWQPRFRFRLHISKTQFIAYTHTPSAFSPLSHLMASSNTPNTSNSGNATAQNASRPAATSPFPQAIAYFASHTVIPIEDDDITFNGQPLCALYEQQARRTVMYYSDDGNAERGRSKRRVER